MRPTRQQRPSKNARRAHRACRAPDIGPPLTRRIAAPRRFKLAFRVYDFDGDKKLGFKDLSQLLRTLLPEGTDEQMIEQVISRRPNFLTP